MLTPLQLADLPPENLMCSAHTTAARSGESANLQLHQYDARKLFCLLQKYPGHEIVKLLEELGLDFGACSNAYTSADETVSRAWQPACRKAEAVAGQPVPALFERLYIMRHACL